MIAGDHQEPVQAASLLRRWLPAAGLLVLAVVAYVSGLQHYLSLAAIAENRDLLKAFAANHRLAAILAYMSAYIAMTVLSLPGAAVMSIAGGFLFGWWLSAPVSVTAATIGATIVFHIVRTSGGSALAERAGPMARKLSAGFAADAFNYLLFLRLLPVFPFFLVNAVAGLCRVRAATFVVATIVGIIPGALAFAYLGTGLDSIITAQEKLYRECLAAKGASACVFELDAGALVTPQIVIAFAVLGLAALIPLVFKYLIQRKKRP